MIIFDCLLPTAYFILPFPAAHFVRWALSTRVSVLLVWVRVFRIVSATYCLWASVSIEPEGRQRPWLNRDSETPVV